jgi:hypothetical protein
MKDFQILSIERTVASRQEPGRTGNQADAGSVQVAFEGQTRTVTTTARLSAFHR